MHNKIFVFLFFLIGCEHPGKSPTLQGDSKIIILQNNVLKNTISRDDIKKITIDSDYINILLRDEIASTFDGMIFPNGKNVFVVTKNDTDSVKVTILPATVSFLPPRPVIHSSEKKISENGSIRIVIWHLKSNEEKQEVTQLVDVLKKIKEVEIVK